MKYISIFISFILDYVRFEFFFVKFDYGNLLWHIQITWGLCNLMISILRFKPNHSDTMSFLQSFRIFHSDIKNLISTSMWKLFCVFLSYFAWSIHSVHHIELTPNYVCSKFNVFPAVWHGTPSCWIRISSISMSCISFHIKNSIIVRYRSAFTAREPSFTKNTDQWNLQLNNYTKQSHSEHALGFRGSA